MKLFGIISVDFDVIAELLSDILHLSNTEYEMGVQWDSTTSAIRDFKEAYDTVRREVFYKILIEF
jgi:hypothetical protein